MTSTAHATVQDRQSHPQRLAARLALRWAECALALAMLAALLVSGCNAHCWKGPDGRQRLTSDPPEAYPPEERINVHPGQWR